MQESGVRCALVVRKEQRIRDAGEPIERVPDLPACIQPQGSRANLIDDDGDRRRRRQVAQLGVVAEESADPEGVRRGDGDDRIRLVQGGRRRGVPAGAENVVRGFFVRIERTRHIDDGLLGPFPAGLQGTGEARGRELRPSAGAIDAGEHIEVSGARRHYGGEAGEFRAVEPAELGTATGGGDPGSVIAETQEQREGGRDGVGVDEGGASTETREFAGQQHRDGRASGGAVRSPHGDQTMREVAARAVLDRRGRPERA